MISVTEHAAKELQSLLKVSKAQPGRAVRLSPNNKGGISMGVAAPDEGDTIIMYDDAPVLIVAATIAQALDGLVFDYDMSEVDGRPHNGFTFRKPTEQN